MLTTELPTTARILKVPFFVIQGREDMATPTSVAVSYFNVVKAPKKKLVIIEHAGHFALVTIVRNSLRLLLRRCGRLPLRASDIKNHKNVLLPRDE